MVSKMSNVYWSLKCSVKLCLELECSVRLCLELLKALFSLLTFTCRSRIHFQLIRMSFTKLQNILKQPPERTEC